MKIGRCHKNSVHRMGWRWCASLRAGHALRRAGRVERDFCTPQYAMVYAPEGGAVYIDEVRGRRVVGKGDVYQRFPGQVHTVEYTDEVMQYYVAVPVEVYRMLELTGMVNRDNAVLHVGVSNELRRRFEDLTHELAGQSDRSLMLTLNRMQELITDLHLRARGANDGEWDDWAEEACLLLSRRLGEKLDIPAVARNMSMSYHTFRKRFREHMGTSPGEYRIRKRIERARELLCREDVRPKEIPPQLGYYDYYAFSAQFKKMTGMSPREFRRAEGVEG